MASVHTHDTAHTRQRDFSLSDADIAHDLPREDTMEARHRPDVHIDVTPRRVLPATRSRGRAAQATPAHNRADDALVALGFGLVASMCGLLVMLASGYGAV